MHGDHLVGNRYFVPLFVFYIESVMPGPPFIPESIFSTQSVILSPRFIPESVFYTQSVVRSPQSMFYTDLVFTLGSANSYETFRQISEVWGNAQA